MKVLLIHDVLDKLLVDRRHDPMGRADGIVVEISDEGPPRVVAVESGFAVLGRRVHPAAEYWVRWLARKFSPRRGEIAVIEWAKIGKIDVEMHVDADAEESPGTLWERWLREHVMKHIPSIHKHK